MTLPFPVAKDKRTKTAQLLDKALAQREKANDQRAKDHLQLALSVITEADEPLRPRIEEELRVIEAHSRLIAETLALKAEAKEPKGAVEILEAGLARNPDGPGANAARAMIEQLRARKHDP